MRQDEQITKVAFRLMRSKYARGIGPEILAVMPEVPGTADPYTCTCYAYEDGHGVTNPHDVLHKSRALPECVYAAYPVTSGKWAKVQEEYRRLLVDLVGAGYHVQVVRKLNRAAYLTARRAEINRVTRANA